MKFILRGWIEESGWGENDFALVFKDGIFEPLDEEAKNSYLNEQGYFDCGEPLAEIFYNILSEKFISMRYFLSEKEQDLNEATMGLLKKVFGAVDAVYSSRYSEYTGYLWTDAELDVGGHDLLAELANESPKYLLMEIRIHSEDCK